MTRVAVVGEPMVESYQGPSGKDQQGFGGDAFNTAVYLARSDPDLGVSLVSAVGDDEASAGLVDACREAGIDVTHLRRVSGATLGRYIVSIDAAGERSFGYRRSRSPFRGALDAGDLLPDPAALDVLVFSGIAMAVLHEPGRRNLLTLAEGVRARGGMVVYDPNHRPALWVDRTTALEWTQRIVSISDQVLASVDDGRELTDRGAAVDIAAAFRDMGALEVVVTDGPRPCAIAFGDRIQEVDAQPAPLVIDTTAAGDAFDAGYLASRLRGADPVESATAGHRLAARVVAHRGAIVAADPRP